MWLAGNIKYIGLPIVHIKVFKMDMIREVSQIYPAVTSQPHGKFQT